MQTIAEKVVQDHLVEYDSERIFLSQKALHHTQEKLAALQAERQEKIAEVVKAVIERYCMHFFDLVLLPAKRVD